MSELSKLNTKKKSLEKRIQVLEERTKEKMNILLSDKNQMEKDFADIAKQILLDSIIIGKDFSIQHGSIAPYTNGYYITSSHLDFSCTTTKDKWYTELVNNLYDNLIEKGWTYKEFDQLEKKTMKHWNNISLKDNHKYDNEYHISNGYEQGSYKKIFKGDFDGTWSTWTTCLQNTLSKELLILRGIGADFFLQNSDDRFIRFSITKELIETVYKRHNIMAENESLDNDWISKNPDRCVL